MHRSDSCLKKLARMDGALHHREVDRVPVSDFFWGGFLEWWRRELGLPADADVCRHYDLDWIVTTPNMDPHIKGFEVIREELAWFIERLGRFLRLVVHKLNAAKGGGYIFQSDHAVPSNVSGERYQFVIDLVRTFGRYPLQLGQYDEPDLGKNPA